MGSGRGGSRIKVQNTQMRTAGWQQPCAKFKTHRGGGAVIRQQKSASPCSLQAAREQSESPQKWLPPCTAQQVCWLWWCVLHMSNVLETIKPRSPQQAPWSKKVLDTELPQGVLFIRADCWCFTGSEQVTATENYCYSKRCRNQLKYSMCIPHTWHAGHLSISLNVGHHIHQSKDHGLK